MYGQSCIKTGISTQAAIVFSSGEAEYMAMVKAASVAFGTRSMCVDIGEVVRFHLFTDASAAKSIASRRGLGKLRHIVVA